MSPSGRDIVDHRPGGHDDVANVVAGACVQASDGPSTAIPQATNLAPTSYKPVDWARVDPSGRGFRSVRDDFVDL